MAQTSVISSTTEETATPTALPFEPLPAFAALALGDEKAADCQGKRIGILIVTYNALTTLTKVLKRITPAVWKNVEEIAVFDDASHDATYELALGLKARRDLPKLHVLKHQKNLGYGGNQKAGYQYFIDKGFDVVVLLHGDGQYAPEILAHLYAPIVRGEADAVFGSRMMTKYGGPLKGGMPLYKYVGNRILSIFENKSLGMSLTEFHSGYRAYSLDALRRIKFPKMTDQFHFDTEIIIKLNHQGFRIHEVPIPTYYGDEICYVNGMKYAKDVARAVYRYKQTCRAVASYPEFEEYRPHYPLKRGGHSTHDYTRALMRGERVLDLGCGEGYLAAELKEANAALAVTGVDVLESPERRDAMHTYIAADLNEPAVLEERIGEERFDSILLLDTLEHLKNPEQLLSATRGWLESDGRVMVSVPNVANIHVRLNLLFGRFDYQTRGILDRTHLRFFTRKTARKLIAESGFRIVSERATAIPVDVALGLDATNPVARLLNGCAALAAKVWPTLFGYQFLFELAPAARRG